MAWMRAWARQPTTVAGFSAIVGTIVALLLQQLDWYQAIPLLAGSLMSIAMPDDSVVVKQTRVLTTDVIDHFLSKEKTS